jgi:hypothetical protein
LIVEGLGEVITVVDLADSSIDVKTLSAQEIVWSIELFLSKRHAWAVGHDWSLGKLLSLEEHWEWESSSIGLVDFLDLNAVIREEVIQNVVLVTSIVGSIFPKNVEGKYLSVVLQKALQVLVWSSTFKLHLDVVLKLSLIGWSLFHVDHSSSVNEWIIWELLWGVKGFSLISVEVFGELIAVNNSENSTINVKVAGQVEVSPVIELRLVFWEWELVSLEENTLGDSRVLYS